MESLKKKSEFDLTYSQGKFIQNSIFRLFVYDRKDHQDSKVSFVVSKKYGGAVQRNYLKRIMRECWRALDSVPEGKNYILLPKHRMKDAKFEEIKRAFNKLMEKANEKNSG